VNNHIALSDFVNAPGVCYTRLAMAEIDTVRVAPGDRNLERRFIELPHRVYRGVRQWVPYVRRGMCNVLRRKHPFFDHSEGEFLIARRGGDPRAVLGVFENRRANEQRGKREANFYYFDAFDDQDAIDALFEEAFAWARSRGLTEMVGPQLFGGASGNGILVDGFEHRAAMTMMRYNFPYYAEHLQRLGFEKHLDFYSAELKPDQFRLPEKVARVAEKVRERGRLTVRTFSTKRELRDIARHVADLYNDTLAEHEQNYVLTPRELEEMIDEVVSATEPDLVKALAYQDSIVGYLLAFPDISAAIQRGGGRLAPWNILDLLLEKRRTQSLIINGAGIRKEYRRMGGTALLYSELERTAQGRAWRDVDLTQVAETTELMLRDLETLGGRIYKTHRVYRRSVN
jgi:hypothetical protein